MRLCEVQHCGEKHSAKGFCELHYSRHKRGIPLVTDAEALEIDGALANRRANEAYLSRPLLPTGGLSPVCPQRNNPFGHNPECGCRRASQSVPYDEVS